MTHSQSRGRLRHVTAVLAVPLMMASMVAGAGSVAAAVAACRNWTGAQPPSPTAPIGSRCRARTQAVPAATTTCSA